MSLLDLDFGGTPPAAPAAKPPAPVGRTLQSPPTGATDEFDLLFSGAALRTTKVSPALQPMNQSAGSGFDFDPFAISNTDAARTSNAQPQSVAKGGKADEGIQMAEVPKPAEKEVAKQESSPKKKAKGRRVLTTNDLQAYIKQAEAEEAAGEGGGFTLDQLTFTSRPLKPRDRDPEREKRLERIQSHNHEETFRKKDREDMDKKRRKKQLRKHGSFGAAMIDKGMVGGGDGHQSDHSPHNNSFDDGNWDSGYESADSERRQSMDKRRRNRTLQQQASHHLKSIDPRLKAQVRKTDEIDSNLPMKAFLTVIIGFVTGICVQFVSFLSTQMLMNPKQSMTQSLLSQGNLMGGFVVHAGASICLALAAGLIILGFPGPLASLYTGCGAAGGSGIPEVKTYLSGALDKQRMEEPRTLVAKIFSLSFLVASGMPGARDMIHVAALVASNVVRVWASREKALQRSSPIFTSDAPKFVFISAGVSAGIGASFRCPFTGVMFAFEEFSSYWSTETASMCFLGVAVSSFVAWYFTGTDARGVHNFEDTTGEFDPFIIRILPAGFATVADPALRFWDLLMLIVLGVMGGLWGAGFVICNGYGLAYWRKKNMGGEYMKYKKLLEIVVVATVTSAVGVLLPAMWDCRPLSPAEEQALLQKGQRLSWKRSTCPPGQVNEMAALTFQGQGTAMNNLFTETDDMQFGLPTLATYGLAYFVVTVLTIGTATPAGAFIPLVLSGAAWGRALGLVMRAVLDAPPRPGGFAAGGAAGGVGTDVRFYAVMGGAAAFSGFMRMPLAMTAMFMEITGNTVYTPPLLICCTIAKVVADRISPGNTNFMCRFNDYPLLKEDPPPEFHDRTAADIMTELDKGVAYQPHMIGINDSVEAARKLLDETRHNGFPVVVDCTKDVTLRGLIERSQLKALVDQFSALSSSELSAAGSLYGNDDNADPTRTFQAALASEMQVNQRVVNEGMPAYRVYSWFTSLGIRRLLVVKDGSMEVTGMITRHDLHEACVKWPIAAASAAAAAAAAKTADLAAANARK